MEALAYYWLIALGVVLIGLEALTFSFVLFFIGLGFVSAGVVSYFYPFDSLSTQSAFAFILALLYAVAFRKRLIERISKPHEEEQKPLKRSGIGVVEGGMVRFEGTYWESLDDLDGFKDKEKVKVIDVIENKVKITAL